MNCSNNIDNIVAAPNPLAPYFTHTIHMEIIFSIGGIMHNMIDITKDVLLLLIIHANGNSPIVCIRHIIPSTTIPPKNIKANIIFQSGSSRIHIVGKHIMIYMRPV